MPLVGNIRDFGLSDFLYLVDRGYKTGCLHLSRTDEMASLYFEKGKLLTATRKDDNVPVTDLLVRKGKLTPVQAEQAAQAHQNQNGASMSQVLIDLNLIGRDELQRVLQQHIEESVYALFGWNEGEFRFEQGQRPEPTAPIMPTPLPVEHLIMEGVRRIDEWGRIKDRIPSTDMVVKFIEQPIERAKGINLAADEWRVFARINGKDTLAEIARKTGMSEFDVCRIVYGFLTAGLVDVIRKPALVPMLATGRPLAEAPRIKKSLVTRIINRIRGM
jgi:predicted DNA-binding transcriptional regulator